MKGALRTLVSGAIAMMLASCGGGAGSLDDEVASAAGIDRSGLTVVGAISGFGSIFVGGVEFDTNGAVIEGDGRILAEDDLAVGDVVQVIGTVDQNGATGSAERIFFDAEAKGPVSAIDSMAGTFVVLGRTIRVDAATVFDPAFSLRSLAGLAVGDLVEISGFVAENDELVATRIKSRLIVEEVEVKGRVSALDVDARTFRIGDQRVDYGNASLLGFDGAAPSAGDRVDVRGSLGESGVLLATRLEFESDRVFTGSGEGDVEFEGIVTSREGSTFSVGLQPARLSPSTRFKDGRGAADLEVGVRVEVEGRFDEDGVLEATEIELRRAVDSELEGIVESIDVARGMLIVSGLTITVVDTTQFEDESDRATRRFGLVDLVVGDFVEIRGTFMDGRLRAQRIERDGEDALDLDSDTDEQELPGARVDLELEGALTAIDTDGIELLGSRVVFTATTRFELDENVDRATFVAAVAPGDRVAVAARRAEDGRLVAQKVELED